jgi:hypothetical protein
MSNCSFKMRSGWISEGFGLSSLTFGSNKI